MTEEKKEPEREAGVITPTSYPHSASLTLTLEISVKDAEQESYLFAVPAVVGQIPVPQIGFLADLFDLLNFEANLGVVKINGFTHDQITKTLQAGL